MEEFKLIVAGGRDFSNFAYMAKVLDCLLKNKTDVAIVCGEARGADALGKKYAQLRGHKVISMPADWDTFGKSAGYKRNEQMAQVADALVAFWDGKSRGTKHMIDLADKYKLLKRVINY